MATEGTAYCSIEGNEETKQFTKVGPDGNGWVLLDGEAGVKKFCDDNPKLYHQRLAEHSKKHVCAFFGGWGFSADGSTTSVVFLRYEFKGGLKSEKPKDVIQDPTTMVGIAGHELYKDYKKVRAKRGSVCVWQRDQAGEIAINFCVG